MSEYTPVPSDVVTARLDMVEAILLSLADNYNCKEQEFTISPRHLNNLIWAALELTQQGQEAAAKLEAAPA